MALAVANPPADRSNAELIRWAFGMLNRRDIDALGRIWTADSIGRFPDRTCRGSEEIAAYFERALASIQDWRIEVVAIVEQDDDVFVRWHLTGVHSGPFVGLAATGRPLAIDGVDHFVLRNGKVLTSLVVVDPLQYARQVGVMPRDGSPTDRALRATLNTRTKLAAKLRSLSLPTAIGSARAR